MCGGNLRRSDWVTGWPMGWPVICVLVLTTHPNDVTMTSHQPHGDSMNQPTKTFRVCNMAGGLHDFEVHGVDCGDPKRKHAKGLVTQAWRTTGATASDVVAAEVAESASDGTNWPTEAFHVFPCAR